MMLEEKYKEFAVKSFITEKLNLAYRILKTISIGLVLVFQNVVLFIRISITNSKNKFLYFHKLTPMGIVPQPDLQDIMTICQLEMV